MKFDRVVCINLARRPDRWQEFQARIPADFPFGDVERYDAIDGKLTPPPHWWKGGGGAWGCYRSHMRILEECLHAGHKSYLVFEDDATFVDGFSKQASEYLAAMPKDWGLAYLGGQHLKVGKAAPQKINELVYRPYNVNRTHAFAVRGERMMRSLYQHLNAMTWRTAHHIDHRLGALHQKRQDPIYTPREWLCGQAEGRSNVCGREVPYRKWAPAELLAEDPARKFVAVIGLHSSGSSLLAMMLDKLGVHMGNKLGGYHGGEAVGLAKLCEKIARFPATEIAMPAGKVRKKLAKWVNKNRREAAEKKTIGGAKYPHLCVFGDHLQAICGKSLRVIHIDRPLDESIASLQRRSRRETGWLGIEDEQAEAVQRWLWDSKQSFLKSQKHLTVNYTDLLSDPVAQCDRIIDYLEIDPTPDQYRDALSLVDASKRHVNLSSNQPSSKTSQRFQSLPREGITLEKDSTETQSLTPVNKVAFVTCFFNPQRSRNRVAIYPRFAKAIKDQGASLFCLEGLYGHAASQVDSTWQVSIDPDAVFWHKESLLQLCIDRVPDEYDAVCWIDADLIYDASDIGDRILEQLGKYTVVQPWSTITYLNADGKPVPGNVKRLSMSQYNLGRVHPSADSKYSYPGGVWAARRETLAQCGGIYSESITGGGDVVWAAAAVGDYAAMDISRWSTAYKSHMLAWAKRLTQVTQGRVGVLDAHLNHLYHGDRVNRQYQSRHEALRRFAFNPSLHLERCGNGTLRWADAAPDELRKDIAKYMYTRREDE